jgi:hypothetical protein
MVAAIGIGLLLAPLTIIWLIENDPTVDWLVAFRTSADIWLAAHGTRLVVPAGEIGGVAVETFVIGLLPLGYTALIATMAYRLGRRLTTTAELWPGFASAVGCYGLVSFGLSTAAHTSLIYPVSWQGTFIPPSLFGFFVALGALFGTRPVLAEGLPEPLERVWVRNWWVTKFDRMHWAVQALWQPALRAGTGIVVALLAVSSAVIGLMLAVNWIQVIRLYEILQVSFLGGTAVTVGQLALLPNLAIYGVSWMLGVGFQLGEGSLISPLGTAVGPLPSLPITAVLPIGELSFGMAVLAIPVAIIFLATVAVRKYAAEIRFEFASAISAALALSASIALVAATELAILVSLASGAVGPGRLQVVGASPGLVFGVAFAMIFAVAFLASFFSAKPDRADHPIITKR